MATVAAQGNQLDSKGSTVKTRPKRGSKTVETETDNKDWLSPEIRGGPPIDPSQWPDKPLLLCVHQHHNNYVHTNYDEQVAIPINQVFELESRVFKGKGIVRIVDTATTDKKYFKGRRRKSDCTTQGVFKKRIRFDQVFTGQAFDRPFRHIPSPYLVSTGFKILTALAPSLKADIDSAEPYLMSPWPSACQTFNICKVGDENPLPAEPVEDISILDPKFKGMSFSSRKSLFHDPEELKKYYFEPGFVYTMSFYSHMFSPASYSLHMLRMKWGIEGYIPAPMMINAIILDDNQIVKSFVCENMISDEEVAPKLLDEIAKAKSVELDTSANSDKSDASDDNIADMEPTKLVATLSNQSSKNVVDANVDHTDSTHNIDNDIASGGRRRNSAVNKNDIEQKIDSVNTENETKESKEANDAAPTETQKKSILDYEMVYSFNIWHTRLLEEFYGIKVDEQSSKLGFRKSKSSKNSNSSSAQSSTPNSAKSEKKRKLFGKKR